MNLKRNIHSKLLIWAFIGSISLPGLLSLLPVETTNRVIDENRRLSPFPDFNLVLNEIQKFPRGVERYFNDHFQLRDYLILGNNYLEHKLWKRSSNGNVVIGVDGWLFWGGDNVLEDFLSLQPFSVEQLQKRQRILESKRDWLAKHGIRYLFMIPPDKQSIYPEFMPKAYRAMQGPSRLDQFVTYMRQHSDVDILDFRQKLRAAKADRQVYFRKDSHWNEMGALIASREIFKRLAPSGGLDSNHVPIKKLADYRIHTAERQQSGDLERLLGYPIGDHDERYIIEPKFKRISNVEQLPGYLGQNWKPMSPPFVLTGARNGLNCVVFHDSFATFFYSYFPERFQRSLFLWHHNPTGNLFKMVVEAEQPDIVIEEVCERFLYSIKTEAEYFPMD